MAIISVTNFNVETDQIGSAYLAIQGDYVSYGAGNNLQAFPTSTALSGTVSNQVASGTATNLLTASSSATFAGLTMGQIITTNMTGNKYFRLVMICSPTQILVDNIATITGSTLSTATFNLARDWGLSWQAREAEYLTITDIQDYAQLNVLLTPIHSMQSQSAVQNLVKNAFASPITGLNQVCANSGYAGVTSADTFALYWNQGTGAVATSTFNAAMFSPDFAQAYYLVNNARPSAWNVFPPAISNMGYYTGSTYTQGFSVDASNYGGFPSITLTPSGTVTVASSNNITMTALVRPVSAYSTVSGVTPYTGATTRTYTITGLSTGGMTTQTFTPASSYAGDQILAITAVTISNITVSGSITIGGTNVRTWPNTVQSA